MEKIIKFYPAWDKRNTDPKKDYGIHGVEMGFFLKGEKGTIQFKLSTNWFLPHVAREMKHSYDWKYSDYGVYCPFKPFPTDLGYHSPVPMYEDHTCISEECEWTGGKCYYDGSTLNAEGIFDILVKEGDEAVWRALEEEYQIRFEGKEV